MSGEIQLVPLSVVAGVLLLFVFVGLFSRGADTSEYGLGGRHVGRIGSGAAIASNWMSAASIMGMAGICYISGYHAFAYVIGWTGGYVLLLVLMASQIRRFGKFTAPEFVGDRYDSKAARLIASCISIAIALIYCIAQFRGIGLLFSWLLSVEYTSGLVIGVGSMISYLVISGLLRVTRHQQLQYFILIVSFILPLMWIAHRLGYFWILPQFGYGEALPEIQRQLGTELTEPFASGSLYSWLSLCFTLMLGTAGLPHVLSRFYVVPNVREARWSLVWGLFFIALIYWSAPAYAVFARLFEVRGGILPPGATPEMTADTIILRTGLLAGLPEWLLGILVAGAICASFFTAASLLISGAAIFSYDVYAGFLRKSARDYEKMVAAKAAVPIMAVVVLFFAGSLHGLIAEITATAFALAGNTIFPVFLLGIWWWRTNRYGAIAGMITGVLITFSAPVLGPVSPSIAAIFPLTSSALVGVPLVIAVIVAVSLLTPPPRDEIREFLAVQVHGHLD